MIDSGPVIDGCCGKGEIKVEFFTSSFKQRERERKKFKKSYNYMNGKFFFVVVVTAADLEETLVSQVGQGGYRFRTVFDQKTT